MTFNKQEALNKAEVLAKGFNPKKAKDYANKHSDEKWYDDFILLYEMITDKNFSLNSSVYLSIAGALAYVVMPLDVIPDFIPGFGFIDDIFVVGVVMSSIDDEVKRYKSYLLK